LRHDAPLEAASVSAHAARSLEPQIPSLVSMSCGVAHDNPAGWDLAFEFAFHDAVGFAAFAAHAAHEDFVARHVHTHAETVMSVDYDDTAAPATAEKRSRP
jgi:hypothetical protein